MSRSFGGTSFTTVPPIEIVPLVISSSPAIILSVVDFPHPDGPTKTTNSRSAISRLTRSTTRTPPSKTFTTSFRFTPAMSPLPSRGEGGGIILKRGPPGGPGSGSRLGAAAPRHRAQFAQKTRDGRGRGLHFEGRPGAGFW